MKREKPGWGEEFKAEKAEYRRFRQLQGIVVPICYGETWYHGTRALLMSHIGGVNLATPAGSLLDVADLRRMLHEALFQMGRFGAVQGDVKLDNFHTVGDKIMVVDLEQTEPCLPDDVPNHLANLVQSLASLYEHNQYCYWEDGLLMIEGA